MIKGSVGREFSKLCRLLLSCECLPLSDGGLLVPHRDITRRSTRQLDMLGRMECAKESAVPTSQFDTLGLGPRCPSLHVCADITRQIIPHMLPE